MSAAPFSSSRRAFAWRYLLALVLTSGLTAVGLSGGTWYLDHKLTSAEEVILDLAVEAPGAANYLILGSDSRRFVSDDADATSFGDTSDVGGQRADAIIVARVDPKTKRGLLVSFPRDLLVDIPGRGKARINESFASGPQGVIDTLAANFSIPIHHYVQLDFGSFRTMVDAIGGVTMYLPAPVRDRKTGLDVPTAGCVAFDGRTALAWVRSRSFSYLEAGRWRTDPRADLGRIERQQEFIRRLMSQAIRKGALNPLRANRLADVAFENLTVDDGLTVRDTLRLVQAFNGLGPEAVEMLPIPTGSAPGGRLRLDEDAAAPILARLRGAGADAATAVAPSEIRVRVLNGTGGAGAAGDALAALVEAGFVTAGAADAERFDYDRTEVHFGPESAAKAMVVSRYLGGAGRLVSVPGLGSPDVVVIVGQDWTGVAKTPSDPLPLPEDVTPTTATTTRATTNATAPAPSAPAARPSGAPAQPTC